jgi:kynurenine 3-monooxygenase
MDYDCVVYGAGPVGASVALGLQQRGYKVIMYEKRSEAQVITDAGRSINLALSTRGRALLNEVGIYDHLRKTLVPMVMRRFADGSTERYREPLQSINRNLLTIELINAAVNAGVTVIYDYGYEKENLNEETGEVTLQPSGKVIKPRVIIGCDGVHGKVSKIINPNEPARSSRASEWGYYELTIPPEHTSHMDSSSFENFYIWSGKDERKTEFFVGLPNEDKSITMTLFGLVDDVKGREKDANSMVEYLGKYFDDNLDKRCTGIEEAITGGFSPIWLNEHEKIASEIGNTGTFVFLFGDAALGMEQFLGLAVNAGFEGAHRFLENFSRINLSQSQSQSEETLDFWRAQVKARNLLNPGIKALQHAAHLNAASMRDGCDTALGKAIRDVAEKKFGNTDIMKSGFESTHDWWSYCEIPLKVTESLVDWQDVIVEAAKATILSQRGLPDDCPNPSAELSEAEKTMVETMIQGKLETLFADRSRFIQEHADKVDSFFKGE